MTKYKGYYVDEFQYGKHKAETPYQIDQKLSAARNNPKKLEKLKNKYLQQYTGLLYDAAANYPYSGISYNQIETELARFKTWINNSEDRVQTMTSEYKEFMNK